MAILTVGRGTLAAGPRVPATIDAAMRGVSAVVLVSPAIPEQELNAVTDDVPAILGRPARTFEQFATDHAAAFW